MPQGHQVRLDVGTVVEKPPARMARLADGDGGAHETPYFTRAKDGWPPRAVAGKRRVIGPKPNPRDLGGEEGRRLRSAAETDERVRQELGDRFAFITADEVEPPKGRPRTDGLTRITYFSHARNAAVEVVMQGRELKSVRTRKDFRPTEGPDEIRRAVEIARTHRRFGDAVRDHEAYGILAWPPPGHRLASHRVIWVTFHPRGEYHPTHAAAVDLTDERVVHVGPRPWA